MGDWKNFSLSIISVLILCHTISPFDASFCFEHMWFDQMKSYVSTIFGHQTSLISRTRVYVVNFFHWTRMRSFIWLCLKSLVSSWASNVIKKSMTSSEMMSLNVFIKYLLWWRFEYVLKSHARNFSFRCAKTHDKRSYVDEYLWSKMNSSCVFTVILVVIIFWSLKNLVHHMFKCFINDYMCIFT